MFLTKYSPLPAADKEVGPDVVHGQLIEVPTLLSLEEIQEAVHTSRPRGLAPRPQSDLQPLLQPLAEVRLGGEPDHSHGLGDAEDEELGEQLVLHGVDSVEVREALQHPGELCVLGEDV